MPGSFGLSVTPSTPTISWGGEANYFDIELSSIGGYTGDVNLSISGAPVGTAVFSPSTVDVASAPTAPTLIAHVSGGNNFSGVTTSAIDTTGATILVAAVGGGLGGPAFSDSKSNSWTALTSSVGGDGNQIQFFYCSAPTVGSGHTFTATGYYAGVTVLAYNETTPGISNDINVGSASAQPGSATPAHNDELIFTAVVDSDASQPTVNESFTVEAFNPWNGGNCVGVAIATLSQSTAGTIDPIWSASSISATAMCSFVALEGGTAGSSSTFTYTPTLTVVPGSYTATVTATDGVLTQTENINFTITGAAFPAIAPSQYKAATWWSTGPRNGIFYVGQTPVIQFSSAISPTAYSVYNYFGEEVSSGSLSGSITTLTPATPSGGWKLGWYRIYVTGSITDPIFGNSYCITNFAIINDDPNFITMPSPSTSSGGSGYDQYPDLIAKAILGIGTSRISINNTLSPGTDLTEGEAMAATGQTYWTNPGSPYLDPVRQRNLICNFPSQSVDYLNNTDCTFYCKDGTINGANVYIGVSVGSFFGEKIQVYYPNSSTLVETYDNIYAQYGLAETINGISNYIFVAPGNPPNVLNNISPTAIGNTYFSAVSSTVATLYTAGVEYFEGPSNEPNPNSNSVLPGLSQAQAMKIFTAAVHSGNASAKAIGPCYVELDYFEYFLEAGGGVNCDGFSSHVYNVMTNGDINLGRNNFNPIQKLLNQYGVASKPFFVTEGSQTQTPVYAVYHPRRARCTILQTLLMEQYGIPRENNILWYDVSHGFWAVPVWWENGDGSVEPQAILYRTLAEQTFGQNHNQVLDFGIPGDYIFMGSVYAGTSGKTVVVLTTSALPGATVTFNTNQTGTLTVVDAFNNTSTAIVNSSGLFTVNINEVPTYIQLPSSTATISVHSVNDWPPSNIRGQGDDSAPRSLCTIGGVPTNVPVDNGFITAYNGTNPGQFYSQVTLPTTIELQWPTASRVDRVLIWCASAWQLGSALLTFTIDTSIDGSTWVTQKTIDISSQATAFQAGSDSNNTGTVLETYWPEQWIFDEKLPIPITCQAIRVSVSATSYGGEPTAECMGAGGQGADTELIAIQRIAALCDNNTILQFVR